MFSTFMGLAIILTNPVTLGKHWTAKRELREQSTVSALLEPRFTATELSIGVLIKGGVMVRLMALYQ